MTHRTLDVVLYTEGLPFTGDTLEQRSVGGSETAFIYVARELARLGHKVTAYCRCTKEGLYDGVSYKDLSKADELTQSECDLFICSRYFLVFTKLVRAKVSFFWMHDVLVEGLNEYLTFLGPKMDVIYGLTDYHCRRIAQTVPELQSKLRKLMNGLDPALVADTLGESKGKRHKIMFTSRPERGLWQALDAYEQLQDRSLEFLICSYSSFDRSDVSALEAGCRQRIDGLVKRGFPVSTGSFTKRDLYRHIAESKVVVYPTDFPEIFCISAIEAQACGTAFLTYDEFAFPETVGYEGVAYGDTKAFGQRLKALLWDTALRHEIEEEGREHVKPYTWQNVARLLTNEAEQRLVLNAASEIPPRRDYDRRGQSVPLYSERLANVLAACL
jgi:glycosyltransferase involved in cell wall biosynthesis